jgi:hypothetical protein
MQTQLLLLVRQRCEHFYTVRGCLSAWHCSPALHVSLYVRVRPVVVLVTCSVTHADGCATVTRQLQLCK